MWLAWLLGELQNRGAMSFELKMDNKAAIALSKNSVFHEHSKHIDTRHHFIRDCIDQGKAEIEYIATFAQLADILGRTSFQELHSRIGMVQSKVFEC
jgi:hypothetical protein